MSQIDDFDTKSAPYNITLNSPGSSSHINHITLTNLEPNLGARDFNYQPPRTRGLGSYTQDYLPISSESSFNATHINT